METTPPEAAETFLAHPETLLTVETLLERGAFEGGFLLVGADGQGKATLAYLLAATLLSGGQRLGDVDPQLRSQVIAGSHPDLLTLRRAESERTGKLRQEIDVDQVRAAIARVQTTSTTGRRVLIVDLADDLGRSASNSLLKLLEEPPRGTCLLLLSLSTSRLLPTLVSRCRRIALKPVDDAPLTAWLADQTRLPSDQAARLARDAAGAPGRALTLAGGDGLAAAGLADAFLAAVDSGADLLTVARGFGGKVEERVAEDAQALVLSRLAARLRASTAHRGRYLDAYDQARRVFAYQGTADPAQTALMAGLAVRRSLGAHR